MIRSQLDQQLHSTAEYRLDGVLAVVMACSGALSLSDALSLDEDQLIILAKAIERIAPNPRTAGYLRHIEWLEGERLKNWEERRAQIKEVTP